MTKTEIIRRITEPGVVAIYRAESAAAFSKVAGALLAGGITAMEITMTTPGALEALAAARRQLGEAVLLGIGTVLDGNTAKSAIEAGAEFVVTPVFRPEVIAVCQRAEKPVMSGAYTPTEAFTAVEAGADFVKIFPADGLGPGYIKAIRAPLPQLKIIPTGGVDVKTCGQFIKAGCVAVAAGGSLISKHVLEREDWDALTQTAAAFVEAVRRARNGG
jgi:2-dehydro-3-deoxyphosphogluconate aldolase / (4S)-4-hydroxy-2-oxoglutarate aldolase